MAWGYNNYLTKAEIVRKSSMKDKAEKGKADEKTQEPVQCRAYADETTQEAVGNPAKKILKKVDKPYNDVPTFPDTWEI